MSVPVLLGLAGLGVLASGGRSAGSFWDSLPENLGRSTEGQRKLLNELAARAEIDWFPVTVSGRLADGQRATVTLLVSNALKLDGVRVSNLLYPNAQLLADRLKLLLPTKKIADLVHRAAAVTFPFQSLPEFVSAGTNMTKTSTIEHSRRVDVALSGRSGLTDNEGKWFVLSRGHWDRSNRSGTYGWWYDDGKVVHGVDHLFAHELAFADYSQALRYLHPIATVKVEGQPLPLPLPTAVLYTDPQWSAFVSDEGPLPDVRHPGVGVA